MSAATRPPDSTHPAAVIAYIGLGSNLENPEKQLQRALGELSALPQSRCLAYSSLYRSTPMGPKDQPDFINAVLALETSLPPETLLAECQRLEQAHGRIRQAHWGPRTLDLDLLLYGEQRIHTAHLIVPHPGLYERNFVLYPLAEVAARVSPNLQVPGYGSLQGLLANCGRGELEKLP